MEGATAEKADIHQTELYREAEALYKTLRQPGTGQISDAAEIQVSPQGHKAVFAGTLVDKLEGAPPTRICLVDLTSGDTRVLTFGPNTDRLPKFSPDGRHIAFLSDRHKAGDFQLYLLDPGTGAVRSTPRVDGWVEYLHWSRDGNRILLGVAGHGADIEVRAHTREMYVPQDQLSYAAASPSGNYLVIVEGICSDRGILAGDLRLIEVVSGEITRADTQGVDITYTEWRSDRKLLLAGHRGFETVVGLYDSSTETFSEVWSSRDLTTGGRYITVSGSNESGDCALVGESFVRAPEIAVIRQGQYRTVKSFDLGYAQIANKIAATDQLSWKAADGLEIQGWLLQPEGTGPHPSSCISTADPRGIGVPHGWVVPGMCLS